MEEERLNAGGERIRLTEFLQFADEFVIFTAEKSGNFAGSWRDSLSGSSACRNNDLILKI